MLILFQVAENNSGRFSPGVITGIVIGCGAAITLFLILCWWCHHHWKQRQRKKAEKQIQEQTQQYDMEKQQLQQASQRHLQTQAAEQGTSPGSGAGSALVIPEAEKAQQQQPTSVRFHNPFLDRIKSIESNQNRSPSHSRISEMSFSGSVRNSGRFLHRGPSITLIGGATQTHQAQSLAQSPVTTPVPTPQQTARTTEGEAPTEIQI